MMKNLVLVIFASFLVMSCFNQGQGGVSSKPQKNEAVYGLSDSGELTGSKGRKSSFVSEKPYGMVHIRPGSFVMGKTDSDRISSSDAAPRTVTVSSFYMDDTEITNNEYREFINWVRDSIYRDKLAKKAFGLAMTTDDGIGYYRYIDVKEEENPYMEYMKRTYGGLNPNSKTGGRRLDWTKALNWSRDGQRDANCAEVRDSMLIPMEARLTAALEDRVDASKIKYYYVIIDEVKAARDKKPVSKEYLIEHDVTVYPDTTVWVRDFTYSYNLPPLQNYFDSPAYDEYPVVGVNWKQANAFCHWRTMKKNAYQNETKNLRLPSFRLPTEAEWEYAARGGIQNAMYPWGGPYLTDDTGCFLSNFKPLRGNYLADGEFLTAPARSYQPNNFGLYNMSGNVAEWTNTTYSAASAAFVASMNPNFENAKEPRKVIKGGSWKDVSYYLQIGTRDYEYQDSARSYIGFRTVQDYLGRIL